MVSNAKAKDRLNLILKLQKQAWRVPQWSAELISLDGCIGS
jgi:hypothetical protein